MSSRARESEPASDSLSACLFRLFEDNFPLPEGKVEEKTERKTIEKKKSGVSPLKTSIKGLSPASISLTNTKIGEDSPNGKRITFDITIKNNATYPITLSKDKTVIQPSSTYTIKGVEIEMPLEEINKSPFFKQVGSLTQPKSL
jgi:hypothetical protein